MFEHRNSGENQGKEAKNFFKNLRRAYKDLIKVKKFKIISCLCTFKRARTKTQLSILLFHSFCPLKFSISGVGQAA
jgi:hypothetical protein